MVAKKKKAKDATGRDVEGVVVAVEETVERASEVKLEDGTILRARLSVDEAIRLDDQYDNEGNPVYVIKSATLISIVHVDEELKRTEH